MLIQNQKKKGDLVNYLGSQNSFKVIVINNAVDLSLQQLRNKTANRATKLPNCNHFGN